MKIVATTSLPAVDCLNADRWNAARSRQNCQGLQFADQQSQYAKTAIKTGTLYVVKTASIGTVNNDTLTKYNDQSET